MGETLCLHCLNEGEWEDDDKCPTCAAAGHTSPWRVGSCEECSRQFFAKMAAISERVERRVSRADRMAVHVATSLRDGVCSHGLPETVRSSEKIPPWGDGATCKPLCDVCVMDAVREAVRGEDANR